MTHQLVRELLICKALHHVYQRDIITPSLYSQLEQRCITNHLEGYKLLSSPNILSLSDYPHFTQNYIKDMTSQDVTILSSLLKNENHTRV